MIRIISYIVVTTVLLTSLQSCQWKTSCKTAYTSLKNNGYLVPELLSDLDLAVVEECFAFNEYDAYAPISKSGKPVLVVEYELSRNKFCCPAKDLGFSAAKAYIDLDGSWKPCFSTKLQSNLCVLSYL